MIPTLKLYSKEQCKQCIVIKELLRKSNVKFENIMVGSLQKIIVNHEDLEDLIENVSSFPVLIDVSKKIVMDYTTLLNSGKYIESVLNPRLNKYTLFPIKNEFSVFYELYKKQRACFWQPEEIDFSKDDNDLEILNENERYFIFFILAFFAASDALVLENLGTNFNSEIQAQEILHTLAFQTGMEAIHSETYSILLDRYVKENSEKNKMFNALNDIKSIKKKGEWVKKWTNSENIPFNKRVIAISIVEGVMFSGSFCSIYWLKERGLLPGLCFANELISRDEGMHTHTSIEIYKCLENKLLENEVFEIMNEAVTYEIEFITQAIPCAMIGMNSKLMEEYIKFVADRLLLQLGYNKMYKCACPFSFMEKISLNGKTNFFEKRVGEYSKAGVMVNKEKQCFSLEEDF